MTISEIKEKLADLSKYGFSIYDTRWLIPQLQASLERETLLLEALESAEHELLVLDKSVGVSAASLDDVQQALAKHKAQLESLESGG